MSVSLEGAILNVFSGTQLHNNAYRNHFETPRPDSHRFMIVPLSDDGDFEMPAFILKDFREWYLRNKPLKDSFVVRLSTSDYEPKYKTISRYMRDALWYSRSFNLVNLPVKDGNSTKMYYGTCGAIFNSNFVPLLMCSWLMRKTRNSESVRYDYIRPIIRINPGCFFVNDGMTKFITKNFLTTALLRDDVQAWNGDDCKSVKVEIDKCVFKIVEVNHPSINTTDEQLRQIALSHIDEMVG